MEPSGEKKSITLNMVMRVIALSKLQIRSIFNTILRVELPNENAPLADNDIFILLVADMLQRLGFLQAEQRVLILTQLTPVFADQEGEECATCLKQLVFADNQFCTWTGHTGFTDLRTGEALEMIPHPPMETIAYNLGELYRRGVLQIEKRAGMHVKHNANSVDESGDVWQRATDVVP